MSMGLYWRLVAPIEGAHLSQALKYAISRELWDHDGTLGGDATLSAEHIGFLRGMAAAGNDEVRKDCRTLVEAIEKHGAVVVWIE
jgi:hypothetical protein